MARAAARSRSSETPYVTRYVPTLGNWRIRYGLPNATTATFGPRSARQRIDPRGDVLRHGKASLALDATYVRRDDDPVHPFGERGDRVELGARHVRPDLHHARARERGEQCRSEHATRLDLGLRRILDDEERARSRIGTRLSRSRSRVTARCAMSAASARCSGEPTTSRSALERHDRCERRRPTAP